MVLNFFKKDKVYLPNEKIGDYIIQEVIGEGRYGICYLVSHVGKNYIFKQLKKSSLKKIGQKANLEEEILESIKHNSIPRLIKTITTSNCYGYILELKKGKTFEEIVFDEKYIFQRPEIYSIASQIVSILKYLHRLEIVHRDIRLPNLLYDKGKISLIDFGLARRIDRKKYSVDLDFFYLGDFLLHLYYTDFDNQSGKNRSWYDELPLADKERSFLKRLLGIEKKYHSIEQVETDLDKLTANW